MKKLFSYFLLGLLVVAATSCSDDDDPIVKVLKVDPQALQFESEGGSQLLKVTAQAVNWKLEADDWIEHQVNPDNIDEITVSVGPWKKLEERIGTLKLVSLDPEVPSLEIQVKQAPMELAAVIWERTTLQRMNLHGDVKELSYFDALARDGASLYDLQFNEAGMLTQFTHKKNSTNTVTLSLSYDAENRLSEIKGVGTEDDYSIQLSYGNHGKYLPIEELFNDLSMNSGKVINHTLWMPLLVKNLTKVSLVDNQRASNSIDCVATINGDKGTMSLGDAADFYTYTFDGAFIKTSSFQVWFDNVVKSYTIDPENGAYLKTEEVDSGGSIVITYNNDLSNTLQEMTSPYTGKDSFTYNENLDAVKHVKDGKEVRSRSYTYDEQGNWKVATDAKSGAIEREITYR